MQEGNDLTKVGVKDEQIEKADGPEQGVLVEEAAVATAMAYWGE